MLHTLLVLTSLLAAPAATTAASVCEKSGGSARPENVDKLIREARQMLTRKALHITDLPEGALTLRRHLSLPVTAENACSLRDDARALMVAVRSVNVDQRFVSAKLARVMTLVKQSRRGEAEQPDVERLLSSASSLIGKKKVVPANKALNDVLRAILGSADPWLVPEKGATESGSSAHAAPAPEIADEEVIRGCPAIGKRGQASEEELAGLRQRLTKSMDERRIRLLDIKQGSELITELRSFEKVAATWPAARITCALLARVTSAEIDLGFVSQRFQVVRSRIQDKPVPPKQEARFSELVRKASDEIARREFAAAHTSLEELLILLGEPSSPSESLTAAAGLD